MPLWIALSLAAAFFQNVRSMLQKHLRARLSTSGATYSRFLFGVPFAVLYLAGLNVLAGEPVPRPGIAFALNVTVGSLAQILATVCLIHLFSFRNFAVGTTYSKTETIQTALFGLVALGDRASFGALMGIIVSFIGVIAISVAKVELNVKRLLLALTEKTALIGLASGAGFSVAAICYRAASLSLGEGSFFIRAALTLACATMLQTVVMGLYLALRERGEFTRVVLSFRVSIWVGLSGMLASVGWFTAFTIQNAAYVKAVGQVELIFALAATYAFFKERPNATEIGGIALVMAGILAVLLY